MKGWNKVERGSDRKQTHESTGNMTIMKGE